MTDFARTDTSTLSHWWWTVDRWMLAALALLVAIGAVMSLATSPAIAARFGHGSFQFAARQIMFVPVALALMLGISLLKARNVRRVACVMLLFALAMTAAAAQFGPVYNGASRWLPIAGFSLQPSEFLKPSFIVVAAWMFAEHRREDGFPGNKIAIGLMALVILALVSQPDYGQTLLISAAWGVQFFLAGLSMLWVMALIAGAIGGLTWAYMTVPYVAARIDSFLVPASGDTYQIDTALNALRRGGLTGTGPGEGIIKQSLPDAHSDFVFAVIGEEFGLLACLALIAVFAFIVIRALLSLLNEDNLFVFLAVSGLVTLFGLQAIINLGVNLDLLPPKGMTLPFISYGRSSLLALSITMGMVLALTRRRHPTGRLRRPGALVIGR